MKNLPIPFTVANTLEPDGTDSQESSGMLITRLEDAANSFRAVLVVEAIVLGKETPTGL
jgi:hypothetical protein